MNTILLEFSNGLSNEFNGSFAKSLLFWEYIVDDGVEMREAFGPNEGCFPHCIVELEGCGVITTATTRLAYERVLGVLAVSTLNSS